MLTIIFGIIIVSLAAGLIYYYNRGSKNLDINQDGRVNAEDAKVALDRTVSGMVNDTRDARDLALSLASESAGRAINAVETATKTRRATAKKPAAKKPAAKATKPAARATKPRTKKSV